jgi:hypothetical protein
MGRMSGYDLIWGGPESQAFAERLYRSRGYRRGFAPCFFCRHGPPESNGAYQVEHLISPKLRPDLMYDPANCRFSHGSPGNKCRLCIKLGGSGCCNQIASASPDAPRDHLGRHAPFTDEFMAKILRNAPKRPKAKQGAREFAAAQPRTTAPGREW